MESQENMQTDPQRNKVGNETGDNLKVITIETRNPKLTLFQTCSIVVSSTGGCALFIAMSTMMATTGSVGVLLIIILVSGLLNYSLAKCFTEVAIILPKAGGPYLFILDVFGALPAFLFLWGFIFLIISPAWACLAYTSSLYIVQLFFAGCRPPDIAIKLLAACILVSVVLVNCLYLKYVTKIQVLLTSSKMVASGLIVICGIISAFTGNVDNYKHMFEGSTTQPGEIAVSILSGMFLYGGWQLITFLLEEMESPERHLPKALTISFVLVVMLSELIVAAYFTLISPAEMLDADAVAVLFMARVYLPLGPVIAVFVTASSVSGLNAVILAQSRLVTAAARRSHLPTLLATYSEKYRMPWASTICMVWIGTAVVQLGINTTTLAMSIYQRPQYFGSLVVVVLCGVPVYLMFIQWKSKPKLVAETRDKLTIFLQKLLLLEHK